MQDLIRQSHFSTGGGVGTERPGSQLGLLLHVVLPLSFSIKFKRCAPFGATFDISYWQPINEGCE